MSVLCAKSQTQDEFGSKITPTVTLRKEMISMAISEVIGHVPSAFTGAFERRHSEKTADTTETPISAELASYKATAAETARVETRRQKVLIHAAFNNPRWTTFDQRLHAKERALDSQITDLGKRIASAKSQIPALRTKGYIS